jgi:hypothetical protein
MSAWRKFYVDLVDGPERGRRVELPWGKRDWLFAVETEIPFTLEPPSEVTPCNIQTVKYCAMEGGTTQEGQTAEGLVYRIEQWSVDGRRDEYQRLFWQEVAAEMRRDNVERAMRVIESGGYLDV